MGRGEAPLWPRAVERLASGWLVLAIAALLGSGLLALVLVLSRTPALQEAVPWVASFPTALVIHVDLSVVIWSLAFAGLIWSLAGSPRHLWLGWLGLASAALGTATMALSPFLGGDPRPILNNYIPVLDVPVFHAGLVSVAAGFAAAALRALLTVPMRQAGALLGAGCAAVALAAFLWSWATVPAQAAAEGYYEALFWGGGHVLQFVHVLLAGVAWTWLAGGEGRGSAPLFALAAAPVVVAPAIYLAAESDSVAFRSAFTSLMRYGHLAGLPLWLYVVNSTCRHRDAGPRSAGVREALICSLLLFAVGGVLGFLIEGVNVVVPAHYHGSVVGITLAYMGLSYWLLPRLGFGLPLARLAALQPYLYGGGQLLHVLGLAWSGGHGVQRKVAGAAQGLDGLPQVAGMALMGLGGVIAVAGGLLFLAVAIHAMWPWGRRARPSAWPRRSAGGDPAEGLGDR